MKPKMNRRELLGKAAASIAAAPLIQTALPCRATAAPTLNGLAGVDRVTILPGKTYLRGWAGYGDPPRSNRPGRPNDPSPPPVETGPPPTALWSKESGPGAVSFADPKALITTATFSTPGVYILKLTADNG